MPRIRLHGECPSCTLYLRLHRLHMTVLFEEAAWRSTADVRGTACTARLTSAVRTARPPIRWRRSCMSLFTAARRRRRVGAVVLLALACPILAVLALAVRVDSAG